MQLKELTNNQKRKEFLEDYTGWNLWLYVPQVSEKYYLYPLPDNTMMFGTEKNPCFICQKIRRWKHESYQRQIIRLS